MIAVDVHGTFGELGLEYSMFIVTVRAGEQRAGCLVGFGRQRSIDPPRFLICLSRKNHTYRMATSTEAARQCRTRGCSASAARPAAGHALARSAG